MSRIRNVFASLIIAGFSIGAAGCVDMEGEVWDEDEAAFLEATDEVFSPDEPLRAELPPDPTSDDPVQPDATFLETEGEIVAPTEPLRIKLPGDGDDDDGQPDEGSIFQPNQRRQ